MKSVLFLLLVLPFQLWAQPFTSTEVRRYAQQAKQVTVVRDEWGIPHVYGKTDADAVFGLLYAQCEDDFKRVEMNYIEKLGRMSEIKGEESLYNDLQIRLLIDENEAKADYRRAQPWLKKLLNAYADAINYYLFKHPDVKPALLTRFQPWYPLLWTDGSIGAISTADLTVTELKNFYSGTDMSVLPELEKRDWGMEIGSNGLAFGPSKTASGKAILYINPHTTFYFRPEVQAVSEEGLNVYGAVTWGQFFVYQGFNQHLGWMHTSSNVDVADTYAEKVENRKGKWFYEYNRQWKPLVQKNIVLKYKENDAIKSKTISAYFTHHGPIMAKREGKWISLRSNNRSMTSLIQSWQRTKATDFAAYKRAMDLKANTSNNTVYADDKGNIAYWHGNFVPIRDRQFDWSKPVDGSISATEWKGLHRVQDLVHVYNPANGWLQNCNSTPFSAAGDLSPKKADFASYMAPDGENFRGVNAVRLLSKGSHFTLDSVIETGYNHYLPAFEVLIPALLKSFERVQPSDSLYTSLSEPMAILKKWDYYSAENSVATTLAVEWANRLNPIIQKVYINPGELDQVENTKQFAATATPNQLLPQLAAAIRDLKRRFGTWQVAWGEVNRFQRYNSDIDPVFNDAAPSTPVSNGSAIWGSLPSFRSIRKDTNKRYGVSGNSFIAAVEFGDRIKAKSLLAGGESGDMNSPHFLDQAERYAKGQFKDVLFYKEDVHKHAQRTYHPGE